MDCKKIVSLFLKETADFCEMLLTPVHLTETFLEPPAAQSKNCACNRV